MVECEMYGVFIKQIHDELEKQTNNQLRSADLTMAQVGTLVILNRSPEGRMPLKELEKRLHVAQSTALGIVSRLERKGLVEDAGIFHIQIVLTGYDDKLQEGTYVLNTSMTPRQMLEVLAGEAEGET